MQRLEQKTRRKKNKPTTVITSLKGQKNSCCHVKVDVLGQVSASVPPLDSHALCVCVSQRARQEVAVCVRLSWLFNNTSVSTSVSK